MKLDVVLGLQWGDEGKGKIVDVLAGNYPEVERLVGKEMLKKYADATEGEIVLY